MPKLQIEHPHKLPLAEVNKRIDALCASLSEKYGIETRRVSDNEMAFKRTGGSGSMKCLADKVVMIIDLNFAFTPMKAKVESRIRSELARVLA